VTGNLTFNWGCGVSKKNSHWMWRLSKAERIEVLCASCRHGASFFSHGTGVGNPFPLNVVGMAIALCWHYRCTLTFDPLNFGNDQQDTGAYYPRSREIHMGGIPDVSSFITTFCHELAHHIQRMLYGPGNIYKSFEEQLEYEKEADSLSWILYQWYFLETVKRESVKIEKKEFFPYTKKKNQEWIHKKWEKKTRKP
jgi:hypothetical protein